MRGFVLAILLVVAASIGAAALSEAAPTPPIRVASAIALAICVYFAARNGSPSWPVIGHLFGLVFAAAAIWLNWVAWFGVDAGFAIDAAQEAALQAAQMRPDDLFNRIVELSGSRSFPAGGRELSGFWLQALWVSHAALLGLAGFFGGQSAWMVGRAKRRIAKARA